MFPYGFADDLVSSAIGTFTNFIHEFYALLGVGAGLIVVGVVVRLIKGRA